MTLNLPKIREELCVDLRNANVMSKERRRVTTKTDSWTASGVQKKFIVTEPGIKNVRSVEVNSTPLTYGTEYEVDYHSGEVTLETATSVGDTLDIEYDYGDDKIFPDLPRHDIDLDIGYPRVGFDDISHSNTEQALGATLIRTDILISLVVYAKKKDTVMEIWQACRDRVLSKKKGYFHFSFITLAGAGPMELSAERNNKVLQKNQDFRIPFEYEVT